MPAYNAVKTLEKTVSSIPKNSFDRIILVDDASKDGTYELALKLGLDATRHQENRGYGANQKTCYTRALQAGADIIVMLHPDYQYEPNIIPFLTGIIEKDICDIVLGNRIRTRAEALKGGMPVYKYLANRFLTMAENLAAGQNLGEWHSGLRAYSKRSLESLNWRDNSDEFVFDSQLLLEAAFRGLRIGDIPVPAKYFNDASSISFPRSVKYGLATLLAIAEYGGNKTGFIRTRRYKERLKGGGEENRE
ncbi:MAG: glycosyltransferase family 2 protein [Elusimicrobia bacterium]|nr:glycosyltransferase family 2 protein [Elusimicrobiota bacterium]